MKKLSKIIIPLIIIGCLFIINNIDNTSKVNVTSETLNGIKVSFLDVGQGDSILIQTSDKNMLIDAGNTEDGSKLVEYFKEQGINEFNYVIGTHAHEDHIGGMSKIINNFKIDKFYMPDVITTTKTFEDTLDALNNNNVKFETPTIGDTFNLGDAVIKVLYVGTDSSNLNNSSIVLKMTYGNIKYLFMGDATTSVEKEILGDDLKADILKVGHHGSSTSSSDEFLNKVNPEYAIISVGLNNSYNLPSDKTINRLGNVNVYRTDESGTIIVTSDGGSINIETLKTDTNGQ